MDEQIIPINTGVIDREPQTGDYVAGVETGILYESREKTWLPFVQSNPDNNYQWCACSSGVNFDTLACSNFACKHSAKIQLDYLLQNNKLSFDEVTKLTNAGFIVNGKAVELSARFNAIKSGTNGGQIAGQFLGNYVYKPWDSLRHDGICPESLCPFDRTLKDWTYTKFYDPTCITQQALDAAKVWLEVIETRYEVVFATLPDIQKHVQQAPLCISAGVCHPWDTFVNACGLKSGHCTGVLEAPLNYGIVDSYNPILKTLEAGYGISGVIKGVLYPLSSLTAPILAPQPIHNWIVPMNYKDTSDEVKKLQDFLKAQGFFPKNVNSTGFYGLVTCLAVLKFQIHYNLDSVANLTTWGGKHVASRTLAQLNLLSK